MEAVQAVRADGVFRARRRIVATTAVVFTIATLLVAGGTGRPYTKISDWAYNRVNTNISLPLTNWQLEVRMRWVKALPAAPATIQQLIQAHPIKSKLYSVGLLCSPRWTLMWAWLFDRRPGLELLHLHATQHQTQMMDYLTIVLNAVMPDTPGSGLEGTNAKGSFIIQMLQLMLQCSSGSLFWLGWLLCPGLQTAYYMFLFAASSPIQVAYAMIVGLARTTVEVSALIKCTRSLMRRNKRAVVYSLLCCYFLPFIMTCQSLAVLLLLGLCLPSWLLHISVVAFCLWGPPMMIALMTTAWSPERHPAAGIAQAPAGVQDAAAGLRRAAAAGFNAGVGAVDAVAALAGVPAAGGLGAAGAASRLSAAKDDVYWPTPLVVPEEVEEKFTVPSCFMCPITHSIMLQPAVTPMGSTYDRTAIVEWLKSQPRDPLTNRVVKLGSLAPNNALYRCIDEWIQNHKAKLAHSTRLGGNQGSQH